MATEREYILFCDESDRSGAFYSNFYGGLAVGASHYQRVTERLNQKKAELHLFGEVKWEKISEPYANKYIALVQTFFEAVAAGQVRVRIMFRQTAHAAPQLTAEQRDNEFFLLYYQFLKHGFGVAHLPPGQARVRLRLYFDQFPDTSEKAAQFKGFLLGLQRHPAAAAAGVEIFPEDITEVRSHEHVLLQCLDVVLGSMTFRLNNKHKAKHPETGQRGKRTRAKERVYKAILQAIHRIRPGLNIGISTGIAGDLSRRWSEPYLHWAFVPREAQFDKHRTKRHPPKK